MRHILHIFGLHSTVRWLLRLSKSAIWLERRQHKSWQAFIVNLLILHISNDIGSAFSLVAVHLFIYIWQVLWLYRVAWLFMLLLFDIFLCFSELLWRSKNTSLHSLPRLHSWLWLCFQQVNSATIPLYKQMISSNRKCLREMNGTAVNFSHHSSVTTTFWAFSCSCEAELRTSWACLIS